MNSIVSEEPFSIQIFVRKKFIKNKHEEMKVGLEEKILSLMRMKMQI